MKYLKLILLGVSALFLNLTSCSLCAGDHCEEVKCDNGGECIEGDCVCTKGWEGPNCENAMNAKFNGTYTLEEVCDSTSNDTYTVLVYPFISQNRSLALISGLHRDSDPELVLHIQWDGVRFTISPTDIGPGTIETDSISTANSTASMINIVYRFTDDSTGTSETCTAVLTRQ